MRLRQLLPAAAAAVILGGCVAYPYNDRGYYSRSQYPGTYGPGYYSGPGYYTGPSVGFGLTYSDRRDDWRHDERRRRWDRDGDGERDRDYHRDRYR